MPLTMSRIMMNWLSSYTKDCQHSDGDTEANRQCNWCTGSITCCNYTHFTYLTLTAAVNILVFTLRLLTSSVRTLWTAPYLTLTAAVNSCLYTKTVDKQRTYFMNGSLLDTDPPRVLIRGGKKSKYKNLFFFIFFLVFMFFMVLFLFLFSLSFFLLYCYGRPHNDDCTSTQKCTNILRPEYLW